MSRDPQQIQATSRVIPVILIILLWEFIVRALHIAPFLLPAPSRVALRLWRLGFAVWPHIAVTLLEITGGFVIGVTVAVVVSAILLRSRTLDAFLYPIIVATQVIPKIAIAPLLIMWFGYGIGPKIATAALISFFPLLVNLLQGLRAVDPQLVDLMHSIAATPRQIFFRLRIPTAVPYIFSALKIALVYCLVGAIVGEFIGANQGIGFLIVQADASFDTELIFAGLAILTVIGFSLFGLVEVLQRKVISRYPSEQLKMSTFSM